MQISTLTPHMESSRGSKVGVPWAAGLHSSRALQVLLANFVFSDVCHAAVAMGCYLGIVGFYLASYKNLVLALQQCRGCF